MKIQTEDFSQGQILNQEKYDIQPFKAPKYRYLILSSQRTGSNYLCRRLCNLENRFGLPSEYLHPIAVRSFSERLVAKSSRSLDAYMFALERVRTTSDGWFGVKVQPQQLLSLVRGEADEVNTFVERFDRLVLMTRRDKLGQAVSGAIAQVTGKWFGDGKEPDFDDHRIAALFPIISRNLFSYIEEERFILNIGRSIIKPLIRIEYEDIQEDGQSVFLDMVDFLSGGKQMAINESETVNIPEKSSGVIAGKVRSHFLEFISGTRRGIHIPQRTRKQPE